MFKFVRKCINTKPFSWTKHYLDDHGITWAGSKVVFIVVTEISDNVLQGAETRGFNGMVNGFHQGILKLAMEPSLWGTAFMEHGPDAKIKFDRRPRVDELYIEGYIQAMLDVRYKQEHVRVKVTEDEVILENLPPNNFLVNEIMEHVKSFLMSEALLEGKPTMSTSPPHHLRGESEWKIRPMLATLCEHLFVNFSIRWLRKLVSKVIPDIELSGRSQKEIGTGSKIVPSSSKKETKTNRKWSVGGFLLSSVLAYLNGCLCRRIPNPITRRIVSGFMLSFVDNDSSY
eukprot:TRINITY_DN3627_c0_g1_i6.p1 TRINITY_DN3627_c0_g1~~TRINITY_DN3627_c0_g1_i6.p1  ORF type:complete len:286 (+),score=36.22 TRINITY_DN3627_c0_g1_i6:363-1220(+)